MRGIPEDKAIEIGERIDSCKYLECSIEEWLRLECSIEEWLRDECQELQEPWIPVDENAPKDRFILCWIDDLQKKYILKFSTIRNTWLDQGLRTFMEPDLYQELPDDPVMPIHKRSRRND